MLPDHTEEKHFAKELGISPLTMQRRRRQAQRENKPLVPPFVEVCRRFYYPNAAKVEWLKAQQFSPGRANRK